MIASLSLIQMQYLTLIDASSGHHNLKVGKKSYLTTFIYQFGRYRYATSRFSLAPAGDMFQQKVDEIFKDLLNIFGIAYGILIML